jgi:hypothetical protein
VSQRTACQVRQCCWTLLCIQVQPLYGALAPNMMQLSYPVQGFMQMRRQLVRQLPTPMTSTQAQWHCMMVTSMWGTGCTTFWVVTGCNPGHHTLQRGSGMGPTYKG